MSYNGVGLSTARGSGTNGYVQRNFSYVRSTKAYKPLHPSHSSALPPPRPPNPSLVLHDRKRRIEADLLTFALQLEAKGVAADVIEAKVTEMRQLPPRPPGNEATTPQATAQ